MIDINLIRNDRKKVKENIKKKFQDENCPQQTRLLSSILLRNEKTGKLINCCNGRKVLSEEIGNLMKNKEIELANLRKKSVNEINSRVESLEIEEAELQNKIKERMLLIPQIIDESVPIGKDDSENVELEKYGDSVVPAYEIPYHADICEKLNGLVKKVLVEHLVMVFII